jgi:hypothetical protein
MPSELRNCLFCYVKPGELHVLGCSIERCALCGRQLISCGCRQFGQFGRFDAVDRSNYGRLPWTGEYPGNDACREFDLWCYLGDARTKEPLSPKDHTTPGRFFQCSKDHPHAEEDLSRLHQVAYWDKEQRKFVRRIC